VLLRQRADAEVWRAGIVGELGSMASWAPY
jgi:hypothetical protein